MCWLSDLLKPKPIEPPTLEAYDNYVRQQVGTVPILWIKFQELKVNLAELGLECRMRDDYQPDTWVAYTNEESWAKIIPFLTYSASYYVAEGADCDDYARWAAVDASRIFKLNGCLEGWGLMPQGGHAWGLVMTSPKGYKLFEPNAGFEYAGELFANKDNEYNTKSWE